MEGGVLLMEGGAVECADEHGAGGGRGRIGWGQRGRAKGWEVGRRGGEGRWRGPRWTEVVR